MKKGGNQKLKDFLKLYSFDIKSIANEKLYHTKIMEFYRKNLKNIFEGITEEEILHRLKNLLIFWNNNINMNNNNENKFSSVGSEKINNDSKTNDVSFQDNIKKKLVFKGI